MAPFDVIADPAKWTPEGITAVATAIIGLFTVVLVIVTYVQARLIRSSIRLAREEFIASHRPKIRIKHIWLVGFGSNVPVTVKIVYSNVGDAKATISRIGMDFNVINPDAQLPGDLTAPERPYIPYPKFGLGVTETVNVSSLGSLDDEGVQDIRGGKRLLCCFGFIEYSDTGPRGTRKIRRSAFCRIYKPSAHPIDGMGRFVKPTQPDPDYEYED